MRSGEEIQAALRRFASQWEGYQGSEAQTFVNDLFACYGSNGGTTHRPSGEARR